MGQLVGAQAIDEQEDDVALGRQRRGGKGAPGPMMAMSPHALDEARHEVEHGTSGIVGNGQGEARGCGRGRFHDAAVSPPGPRIARPKA